MNQRLEFDVNVDRRTLPQLYAREHFSVCRGGHDLAGPGLSR